MNVRSQFQCHLVSQRIIEILLLENKHKIMAIYFHLIKKANRFKSLSYQKIQLNLDLIIFLIFAAGALLELGNADVNGEIYSIGYADV